MGNAKANVSLKGGKVVAYGSSFVKAPGKPRPEQSQVPLHNSTLITHSSRTIDSITSDAASVDQGGAIKSAEASLNATYDKFPPKLEYVITQEGAAALTWTIQVRNDDHWYAASVDAHTSQVVNVVDYVAEASYRALNINKQVRVKDWTHYQGMF